MNIVVFASGSGTTLQSIIDSIKKGELDAKISLVVSNNKEAYALKRAEDSNIDTYLIKSTKTDEIDAELNSVLNNYAVDLIVLAGYLKLIGKGLINNYKIINTHPSLLPKFGGKGMYGMNVHHAVIESGEKHSGATVHYVNDEYDEGNIISQVSVEVTSSDTKETLSQKVQEVEKIQLIEVLNKFAHDFHKKR